MRNAYDRVEWKFITGMKEKMGFYPKRRCWVIDCMKSVSYRVLTNGSPGLKITPSGGLRQGDPISHFLFLICLERLLAAIMAKGRDQNLYISTSFC